jgi:hypothetical protein
MGGSDLQSCNLNCEDGSRVVGIMVVGTSMEYLFFITVNIVRTCTRVHEINIPQQLRTNDLKTPTLLSILITTKATVK